MTWYTWQLDQKFSGVGISPLSKILVVKVLGADLTHRKSPSWTASHKNAEKNTYHYQQTCLGMHI